MSWRFITFLSVTALSLLQQATAADQAVALITSVDCEMESISHRDIRKAYLGFRVSIDSSSVRAFRLRGDQKLDNIFFQSVVSLSRKSYERHLLRQLLKYGRPRPREFQSLEGVIAALVATPCSIGYAWDSDTKKHDRIKVIRILWQEN